MPRTEQDTCNKRPRDDDDSSMDTSWEKSFKRLRVMDNDGGAQFSNNHGTKILQAVSAEESSNSQGENWTSLTREVGYPQETSHFPQNNHNIIISQERRQYDPRQLQEDQHHYQHFMAEQQHSDSMRELQNPGQDSSEERSINYQPINSFLGNLHRSRRCRLSGTGQSTDTSLHGQPQESSRISIPLNSQLHDSHGIDNWPPSEPNECLGTGVSSQQSRPRKKKNIISLRVDSNLY
ncbi:hypothetical protein IV203_008986 [Nitzschia inconspicua]|uniref:Uncharacterized protein n=1 Tax=Nitzschia inconspicua TaxID=303405 RepID=A0A9K3K654_9STRA|nr:hypothetical protein IV203_011234 [Nitzschia inconspicua]KAG7352938.1 hypothetical protein IV203_008986 [Nitzschia inconspicua]